MCSMFPKPNFLIIQKLTNRFCVQRALFCTNHGDETQTDETRTDEIQTKEVKLSGFAKAYEKHSRIDYSARSTTKELPFPTLLRNSKFIDLGDPEGNIVVGTIFHVVKDDLYIDFGWKFHCVCHRPDKNGSDYVRGAKVRLKIKDLELSTRFLGYEKDLTLLEADAILIGLISSPTRPERERFSSTLFSS